MLEQGPPVLPRAEPLHRSLLLYESDTPGPKNILQAPRLSTKYVLVILGYPFSLNTLHFIVQFLRICNQPFPTFRRFALYIAAQCLP
jgi:hypothetical protein